MTRIAIVLGAAVRPDGTPSAALSRRAETAAELYRSGQVDKIIASGGVPVSGITEAALIRDICQSEGVPNDAIICEHASSNTLENLQNAQPLLPKTCEVTLVTDRYHAPRARLMARHLGIVARSASPKGRPASARYLVRGYLREGAALALYLIRRITSRR